MRMLSGEEAPDAGERVEGHNVVMQYFAQDEATRMDPAPTVYETLASGSPNADGAGDPEHPRRIPVLGRRRLQARAGAVGRRADAARGRAHAAASLERPAARRADQPSRSRLERSAARRAGRLRRHAGVRLARSLFRRASRDEDRRDRQRRRAGLSRDLQGVSLAQGASAEQELQDGRTAGLQKGSPKGGLQKAVAEGRQARPAARVRARTTPRPQRLPPTKTRSAPMPRRASASAPPKRGRPKSTRSKSRSPTARPPSARSNRPWLRPGFYDDRTAAQPIIDRHQALMWQVGDLMHQWEKLQSATDLAEA